MTPSSLEKPMRAAIPTIPALLAAALWLLFAPGPAEAQSFYCDDDSKRVETLICADENLSALDTEMSEAYLAVIDVAADPAGLVRSQRAWLRTRNACGDRACLAAAYDQRRPVVLATPRAGMATHRDPVLGLAFEYLANRRVEPCPEGHSEGPCTAVFGYRGGWPNVHLASFQVFDGTLEAIAQREAGFEPRDGGWFTTYGRFEPQRVELFRSGALSGMRASVICGIEDETGFHAAGGACFWGVLSDGRRSILVTAEGAEGAPPDEIANELAATLQLIQP
ncbi:MAG TPA: lysozyme inhibitor LprI family protein [Brevundimonas sp.]